MSSDSWWHARHEDSEHLAGGLPTREEAEADARKQYDGEPFVLSRASQQPWRYDCFDRLDEEFDNANEELGDGDGDPPSIHAGFSDHRTGTRKDLIDKLETVLREWVEEHGNCTAWALDVHEQIKVDGTPEWKAREAARIAAIVDRSGEAMETAETGSTSGESAARRDRPSSPSTTESI